MDGIRVIPSAKTIGAPSFFSYLFQAVAGELRPLYWYSDRYASSPFYNPNDDRIDDWYESARIPLPIRKTAARDGSMLFRPGTLPDASRNVFNDWIDLIGIAGNKEHAISEAALFCEVENDENEQRYHRLIEQEAQFYFHCMDGRWWEMYARDERHLREVGSRLAVDSSVRVEPTALRARWNSDKPSYLE